MEDDMNENQGCGCDCEMCMQGRHDECPTGKCTMKKTSGDSEDEM